MDRYCYFYVGTERTL